MHTRVALASGKGDVADCVLLVEYVGNRLSGCTKFDVNMVETMTQHLYRLKLH
jgi:hypothetical protein